MLDARKRKQADAFLEAERHVYLLDDGASLTSELLAISRFGSLISASSHQIRRLLVLGMAAFRLDHDTARAKAIFQEAIEWHDHTIEALRAAARGTPAQRAEIVVGTLLLLCVRHLLANDKSRLLELAEAMSMEGMTVENEFDGFVVRLLGLASDRGYQEIVPSSTSRPLGKLWPRAHLLGYDRCLAAIGHKDQAAFESCLIELEAQYRARGKCREPMIHELGYNRLSQEVTFDLVGTALCRLAVWQGMTVPVDNELYPREFYS